MASRAAIVLGLIALMVILMGQSTKVVDFRFSNNVQGTTDTNRFDQEIGKSGAFKIMDSLIKFIWDTFHQQSTTDRKNIEKLTLIVESINNMSIAAYASGDEIHLSADYVGNYEGDVKVEIRGVLYHEMTHVWQWNDKGN
ncbi:hypothetical protein SUGI_0472930 [Cryptomeria japonica]|nr:hypothetical protein SUGI_0472930 [Cryptomeria japonica]